MLPLSTSLSVMDEIAGVNTASLDGYLHSKKKRARMMERSHDELNGHVFDLRGRAPSGCTLAVTHHVMKTSQHDDGILWILNCATMMFSLFLFFLL